MSLPLPWRTFCSLVKMLKILYYRILNYKPQHSSRSQTTIKIQDLYKYVITSYKENTDLYNCQQLELVATVD